MLRSAVLVTERKRILKQVLVLGAGQSSTYLIHHLLQLADTHDWFVTVGDMNLERAKLCVGDNPRGGAVCLDINDSSMRTALIGKADLVINMLLPAHQHLVAWDCVARDTHMLSVAYRDSDMRSLDKDAHRAGVLVLFELGLDPGIDHMSAMALITRVHAEGGRVVSFCSYGSGIPALDQPLNPLRYAITWNPRNVAHAGEHGAQYMESGKIKIVPFHHVFHHTWVVDVPGVGRLEAYPNRDSLSYMRTFGLEHVETMIRATLRHTGWSETWAAIVRLGLPNDQLRIPDLAGRTICEVVEMFLPLNVSGSSTEQRVARFLQISPTGKIIENLRWLGLFSDEPIGCDGETASDMLIHLLNTRLHLGDQRDMVILQHELEVEYAPRQGTPSRKRITSTLVAEGQASGYTAMSRTVGLPTAIATRLLLCGELSLTGCCIPTHSSIYEPVLRELAQEGLSFAEQVEVLH
jgi:saccharopine dehydrogenase-like NADP-dependent oxidoreductase